jgi:hypothetical protein
MAGEGGGIKGKAGRGVRLVEAEEGVGKAAVVEQGQVVVDQVGHVHEDLVEAQALAAGVPGKGAQESIEELRGVSKAGEILAQDDDYVRAELLGL